ncbi:MAG: hypothetical protein JNM69_24005 [Archangium sp.]|nr:hypothetical protein [Archangium sp.]
MVTPNLSGPRAAFLAPRPQLGLAGAWSPNDNSFLVMWDQRDGGAWETREALVDTGGIFELGVVSSSARPSRPSFATAPDGGLYVALSDDVGRRLFPVIGGVLGPQVGVRDGGLLEEIVVGASSYLSWSPGTGSTRHSLGTTLSSAPPPGCVAWSQGVYLLATALGILQVSEPGVTTSLNLPLPAAPLSPFQRCLTLDSRGVKYLTTWTNSDVTVHRVDALASLGQANWALAGPVASVAVHDGVVVVAALVPDGQRNTLVWSFFGGAQSVGGPLTSETQPVRNVRATATPSGDVLASWESFELDAGAWRVAMRLIQGLSPADGGVDGGGTDGGAPDGGAPDGGTPDGGTPDGGASDGGAPDGGSADGGGTDGGAFDGGLDDAGVDAGADGGASAGPIFVPVCGCSTGDGQSLLFAGLVLLLARRARAAR